MLKKYAKQVSVPTKLNNVIDINTIKVYQNTLKTFKSIAQIKIRKSKISTHCPKQNVSNDSE